ncbi:MULTISPECIES: ribonuclease P protein component [Candidatus Ichthyocystis]|uniref:ribonuclease P protein component n=1 Tax=Candidatus Ichthyocystis TaxID=2929841 RepID=UPI001584AEA2|nr:MULTISPECIES: ribonuclease P protein component [Ichthyocystis]
MSKPLSFKRTLRSIRKKSEFVSVYSSKPDSVRSGPFKAYCSADPPFCFARLGMVVPKRSTKTSVKRNLVKRLIRECFREGIDHLPKTDIVVSLKGNVSTMLKSDIRNLLYLLFHALSEKKAKK